MELLFDFVVMIPFSLDDCLWLQAVGVDRWGVALLRSGADSNGELMVNWCVLCTIVRALLAVHCVFPFCLSYLLLLLFSLNTS